MKNIHGGAFRETVDDLLGTNRGEQINTLARSEMSEILSQVWRVFPLVQLFVGGVYTALCQCILIDGVVFCSGVEVFIV